MANWSLKKEFLKIIIDLKEGETQIKIYNKINLIDPILFVARVGILLDFANFGNVNLSCRLP